MKILSTLVLLAALAVPVRGQILERVLVKVNGDIFTQTELEERQTEAIRKRIGVDLKPEVASNTVELKKAIDEVTPELLVNAIDEILMLQMGKEKGYKLTDDQFKDWLEKMRKDNNLQDDQKFFSALKQEGMTVDDLRKNIEKSFMVNQVQRDEVGSKLSITEEEARQYYLAHREEFAEPASVTLREILIEVPTTTKGGQAVMSVATDDEAAQKAAAARARILAGEDFGKVAAEVSASPSKANGGLIGPINLSEVSPNAAADDREDEAGRGDLADPDGARLSDSEARDAEAGGHSAVRERARSRRRQGARRAAAGRGAQVPRARPRSGDHRVEERRAEEDVREPGGLRERARRPVAGSFQLPAASFQPGTRASPFQRAG